MSNVLDEILTWSVGRPVWQRDALRRMVSTTVLEEHEFDELMQLCKQPYGLLPDGEVPLSVVLASEHLPVTVLDGSAVNLTAVETANVNALAQGQRLEFAPAGLTVVYGDNASGKSGYARVLKAACRARGAADAILPNVTAQTPAGTPSATLEWQSGLADKKVVWRSGTPPPPDLSSVSIFDSKSAAAYVSQKNDVAYRPLGLDLFDRLADACDQLRRRLDAEKRELERSVFTVNQVGADTAAGKFLQRLSGLTEDSELEALLLSNDDQAELRQLQTRLTELEATNPAARIAQLRQRLKRAEGLKQFLLAAVQRLGTDGLKALEAVRSHLMTAEAAVRVATAEIRREPLPKVGDGAWRTLWEAAAKYAADAVPGLPFPDVATDAKCVLCQATLDAGARDRLGRFHAFVEGEVSRAATDARSALLEARKLIDKLAFDHASIQDALADLADTECAAPIADWVALAKGARMATLAAVDAPGAALPPATPTLNLAPLEGVIREWAAALSALETMTTDVEARKLLDKRTRELAARAALTEHQEGIKGEIRRKRRIAAYDQCRRDLDTAMITRKSTEITTQFVSEQLRAAFTTECGRLRFRTIEVELKPAGGQRGALYHQIRLRHTSSISLPDVLSEGESRCLSIAAFFAELDLVQPKSGMVFDDPVSSLDHHWRESVADRLVVEAQQRQVIVFTHDVFFLFLLQRFAATKGVDVHYQHLTRGLDGTGICKDALPWGAMKTKQRIGALKAESQSAQALERKATQADYEKEAARIYGLLREAWERAIEEILLNDVVGRFRLSVETQRASKLHDISKEELEQMERAMSKCSTWLTGHDHAVGLNMSMPDAKELDADINALDNWVKAIHKRRS